tara:strand:- start:337 stop:1032 length:696 start_codon:yes stop_codon:yes gene_type:complete
MQTKRLLIIPAKFSSSRLKNKNFKNFYGQMMIEYPFRAAQKSKLFEKIHISTESKIIKKKLIKKNIKIDFLREKKLTNKNVGLFKVYKFIVNEYEKINVFFDEVWTLLPCSPLIDFKDLNKLANLIDKKKIKKPIISICKYAAPIEWAFIKNEKTKKLTPLNKKKHKQQSQDFSQKYFDVGTLSVFDIKNFKTKSDFFEGNFYGFELPFRKSVDIDDKDDWNFANYLYLKK